ncbi:MAG: nucleotidyltransferase domain-containing protein [Candidatus Saganbacteria bacterium]|nr:nucleotidyltransferase domain-containing protein [Candidatus Saganbacteria bacterium]
MISLTEEELLTVKSILAKNIPDCEVLAFGSRVKGKAKKYSDLDVVVVGKEKLGLRKMAEIKEAFQTSRLPFRVEVLDWHRIPDHFKEIIKSKQEIIQLASPFKQKT